MTDSAAAVETALRAEEFIAKIWQERRRFVREGRIKQPHPWQVALSQGMVSKAALIEYVKNRYYETRHDIIYRYLVLGTS
jgi:pyrroloquinoline quinone (PQQ) biosynthesis protein C